jgi:hypothetical protein
LEDNAGTQRSDGLAAGGAVAAFALVRPGRVDGLRGQSAVYGVFITDEFKAREFKAAYGALMRVRRGNFIRT